MQETLKYTSKLVSKLRMFRQLDRVLIVIEHVWISQACALPDMTMLAKKAVAEVKRRVTALVFAN